MDALTEFFEQLREKRYAKGNFLGLLHVLIGRRIETADGQLITSGITWRNLAAILKKYRWDKEAAKELRIETDALPPRDREKLWYSMIAQAHVDSSTAQEAGDRLAEVLRQAGFKVSQAPGEVSSKPEKESRRHGNKEHKAE